MPSNSGEPITTKKRIALVFFPWASTMPYKMISEVVRILETLSDVVIVLGGHTSRLSVDQPNVIIRDIGVGIHYAKGNDTPSWSLGAWIWKLVNAEIKTAIEILRARHEVDIVVFYMAHPYHLAGIIMARILGKKAVEIVTWGRSTSIISKVLRTQDRLTYRLVDGISPESKSVIREAGLARYRDQLLPMSARYIDLSEFGIRKDFNSREYDIGYIGRVVDGKGIEAILESIPMIQSYKKDLKIVIVGSGDLLASLTEKSKEIKEVRGVSISTPGFVPHENIADILNNIKILILPSMSEGLPTILLEAIACGTVVLAYPAGGISDVIIDNQTGFLLRGCSAEEISQGVRRVFASERRSVIIDNGRKLVERDYSFAASLERWGAMISMMNAESGESP